VAIIRNLQELETTVFDCDAHLSTASIETIFDQFLDSGRRSLHDLTSSNPVYDCLLKANYLCRYRVFGRGRLH
jgi:hypothetical protein